MAKFSKNMLISSNQVTQKDGYQLKNENVRKQHPKLARSMYFVTEVSQLFQVNNNFEICFETDRFPRQILQSN